MKGSFGGVRRRAPREGATFREGCYIGVSFSEQCTEACAIPAPNNHA